MSATVGLLGRLPGWGRGTGNSTASFIQQTFSEDLLCLGPELADVQSHWFLLVGAPPVLRNSAEMLRMEVSGLPPDRTRSRGWGAHPLEDKGVQILAVGLLV